MVASETAPVVAVVYCVPNWPAVISACVRPVRVALGQVIVAVVVLP